MTTLKQSLAACVESLNDESSYNRTSLQCVIFVSNHHAELMAMIEDKERLDWLDKHGSKFSYFPGYGMDVRETIDDARASTIGPSTTEPMP